MANIFDPITLNDIVIKNRIVRSATNDHIASADGSINEDQINLYEELAANDVGLIITGHAFVSYPHGKFSLGPQNAIYNDSFIEGYKKAVSAVKKYDSKIIMQISHAGGQTRPESIQGEMPVAPSNIRYYSDVPCRAMTLAEIEQLIIDFADAAYRAKNAGFDGIQLHCAHGYLISEFLCHEFNFRKDSYGGTLENRFRLTKDIILGIQKRCGKRYPIFIKLNSNSRDYAEIYEKELVDMLNEFEILGVQAVELSGFQAFFKGKPEKPYFLEQAVKMKDLVSIPLILVGGIRNLRDMNQIMSAGIDMVSFSRPFICEPDFITKLSQGQAESKCLSCGQCSAVLREKGKRCVRYLKLVN